MFGLEFGAAPYLDDEASVAAYLTDILDANDPALLAAALGDIARARSFLCGDPRERPDTGPDLPPEDIEARLRAFVSRLGSRPPASRREPMDGRRA